MTLRGLGCAVALMLAACLEPATLTCPDGAVCPTSFVCLPSGGCRAAVEVEACAGVTDGEPCTVPAGAGLCAAGVCEVPTCGNGDVEPPEVCDDGNLTNGDGCNGTCSSTEVCGNGISELDEECDCGDAEHPPTASRCDGTRNGDRICTASCNVRRCGDGTVDPGEVCDDGNMMPGDGCNFDCSSNEACGNGVLDYFAGEVCDDANTRSLDGCAGNCVPESRDWRLETFGVVLARHYHAMAYDTARQRIVLFGGTETTATDSVRADTWEYDGARWVKRELDAGQGPLARARHAMAYDSKHGVVVLYGGIGLNNEQLNDTWTFDGVTWRQIAVTGPGTRYEHQMTYDPKRGRIIVFGGYGEGDSPGEHWEFDGTSWSKITAATMPGTRVGHGLTYDPVRGRVVLFGGFLQFAGTYPEDTWEFDGTTWTERTLTPPTSSGRAFRLAWNVELQRVVAFDGYAVWQLDPTTWTELTPTDPPGSASSEQFAMAYDAARKALVVHGGNNGSVLDNTSRFDGTTWTGLMAPDVPMARSTAAATYDSARGRVVLFGGTDYNYTQFDGSTWEYDGTHWIEAASSGPAGRADLTMAYDSTRRVAVMFGGYATSTMGDTWEYNGTSWSERTLATAPEARFAAAMTYDVARARCVLFGGASPSSAFEGTWELDAAGWVKRTVTAPSPRTFHTLTYDSARKRSVLFGGYSSSQLGDTWTFDGTWMNAQPVASPSARGYHVMAFDAHRGTHILYGGADASSSSGVVQTWEYDGTTWTRLQTANAPSRRYMPTATYNPLLKRVVLFGGVSTAFGAGNPALDETWTFGFDPVMPVQGCSSAIDNDHDGKLGCADEDCWAVCAPMCGPTIAVSACTVGPRCGDAICDAVEDCRVCPGDCPKNTAACPIACGDLFCDAPTETTASCPGDCQ